MLIRHSYFQLAMGICNRNSYWSLHFVVACLYREDLFGTHHEFRVESSFSQTRTWLVQLVRYVWHIRDGRFVSDDVLSGTARRGRWL